MRVRILLTGGTLGMTAGGDGLAPAAAGPAILALSGLDQIAEVDCRTLMTRDSSDIGPPEWQTIAAEVVRSYAEVDGFVVIHGTDTMAYSASAVSFLLPHLGKPVVFTGSQRPIHEPRSDAPTNVIDAVTVATLAVPEVVVCLHAKLVRGNRCRKRSTAYYDAFDSPSYPNLGRLGVNIELRRDRILPPRSAPGAPQPAPHRLDPNVGLVMLTPALTGPQLRQSTGGLSGVVLLAFGAGNLPVARTDLLDALGSLPCPIVVISQCVQGPVDMSLYPGGRALRDLGAIDGGSMTPEAAITKLMAGLGQGLSDERLRSYMTRSVAGERG